MCLQRPLVSFTLLRISRSTSSPNSTVTCKTKQKENKSEFTNLRVLIGRKEGREMRGSMRKSETLKKPVPKFHGLQPTVPVHSAAQESLTLKVAPSFWFLNINMPFFCWNRFPNCLRKTWFKFLGGSPSKCWPNSMPVFVCIAIGKSGFLKKKNSKWPVTPTFFSGSLFS